MRLLGWCLASLVALSGCSAIINPDESRLGSSDAGVVHGHDAGMPQRDASTPPADSGMPCVIGQHCEGDTLVSCRGGVETRTACQDLGSFCSGDQCQSWICTPGERRCAGDLRGIVVCSPRGDSQTTTPCELGCNPTTNTCVTTPPACAGLPRINLGDTIDLDLCRETDDDTYTRSDGCMADTRANVGDRTYTLTLEHATEVVIELSDADGTAAVDTIVYVRRACDDAATQVACDDDVLCSESTVPTTPGTCTTYEVRQSRITTTLEAGTYYIVADGFAYSTDRQMFRCGSVRLRVTTP